MCRFHNKEAKVKREPIGNISGHFWKKRDERTVTERERGKSKKFERIVQEQAGTFFGNIKSLEDPLS